jgi:GT2 family glycosyltransferase
MGTPRVSVVILNHNGSAVLRRCVESILSFAWDDAEIVVVDNASTDGSADQIAEQFGDRIRLIKRIVNSPTAGRNEGFRTARGEYILSLDNDIVLHDPLILQKARAILERLPNIGVLAFKISSAEQPQEPLAEHWWHPVALRSANQFFYTDWFAEGAVFFRSSVLRVTGGYDEDLFHGFECVDLALRLLSNNVDILYCPNLTCVELRLRGWHHVVRNQINYLTLRNKLWTVWKDFPLSRGIYFATTRIAVEGIRALRYGWGDLWLAAVREGIAAPLAIRQKRRPIPDTTWKRISRIRKGMFCPEATRIEQFKELVGN